MKEYSFGKGSILHHPPQLIIRFLADLASFNSLQDAGNYGSGLPKFHIFCDIFSIPEQKRLPASYDLLHSFVLWATTDPELVDNSIIAGVHFEPVSIATIRKYLSGVRAWHIAQGWPEPLSKSDH